MDEWTAELGYTAGANFQPSEKNPSLFHTSEPCIRFSSALTCPLNQDQRAVSSYSRLKKLKSAGGWSRIHVYVIALFGTGRKSAQQQKAKLRSRPDIIWAETAIPDSFLIYNLLGSAHLFARCELIQAIKVPLFYNFTDGPWKRLSLLFSDLYNTTQTWGTQQTKIELFIL